MTTNYERGRRFERRCRDALREAGFFVVRSAGSKTPADLVAMAPGVTVLVQCKRFMAAWPQDEQDELRGLIARLRVRGLMACMTRTRGPINWLRVKPSGGVELLTERALGLWGLGFEIISMTKDIMERGTDGDDEGNIADRAV